MKTSFAKRIEARKKKILKRLADASANRWFRELSDSNPVIGSNNEKYELAQRPQAINYAGVSAMLKLAKHVEINFASMTKRSSESFGVSDWAKPRLTNVTPAEQNDH